MISLNVIMRPKKIQKSAGIIKKTRKDPGNTKTNQEKRLVTVKRFQFYPIKKTLFVTIHVRNNPEKAATRYISC